MKALMYHYVRGFNYQFPYSKHKDIDDFYYEIKRLKNIGYKFMNISEAINLINHDVDTEKILLLTFDDGLIDHFKAAQILKELNISRGTFYITCKPYLDNKILHVHKAHLIISSQGEKSLKLLYEACDRLNISLNNHKSFNSEKESFKNAYSRHKDNNNINEFKRLINYYGSIGLRDYLLDEILDKLGISLDIKDIYLDLDQIEKISQMGFEIGSHGVSHTLLSRLSENEQRKELFESKIFLENCIGKSITSFCYPYGGKKSYNHTTLKLLKDLNYLNAISVDKLDIEKEMIKNNTYEIPRYDCNQINELFF